MDQTEFDAEMLKIFEEWAAPLRREMKALEDLLDLRNREVERLRDDLLRYRWMEATRRGDDIPQRTVFTAIGIRIDTETDLKGYAFDPLSMMWRNHDRRG